MWPEDPINKFAEDWISTRDKYQSFMAEIGLKNPIDEIALLFINRAAKGDFVISAVKGDGVKLFNSAEDHVNTKPFGTEYDVEYLFLEAECLDGMRVEAMSLLNGLSPLHSALIQNHEEIRHGAPYPVHLSFKCHNMDEYHDAVYALEHSGADGYGVATSVQFCQSDYGVFSYYNVPSLGHIYLKPRVNMRDEMRHSNLKPGEVHEHFFGDEEPKE